jgi:hypothetical protein
MIAKRPDPKLANVRSAAAELRGAVEVGVTYSQYMEKVQHFAAAISLAGQTDAEMAKYKAALGHYRDALAVWGTKIGGCNQYSVEHEPGIFEICRDGVKVSATFAGIQSQLPKKIREADLPNIYTAIIQTYFQKAGEELDEIERKSREQ